jgi:c-di-GMP-binding flagellar brake protein YcgR
LARELVDLSQGGAQVVTSGSLPPGTRVILVLHLDKFQDQVEAGALVRWARVDGLAWRLGVEFTKVDPLAQRKLCAMCGWFTSPEYQVRKHTERRSQVIFPK